MISSLSSVLILLLSLSAGEIPANLHPILSPEFQQRLNDETHSVLAVSDEIKLLVNGSASYPERWRMIEGAKKSIHFSTMYIFHDATTERLGDLLIKKKNEGVDVKLIVYGVYATANMPFYSRMKRNGIPVQKYSSVPDVLGNPLHFWRRHLHDKYLVVDSNEAITGGMNWSERYAHGGTDDPGVAWRDTDIYVKGPQAQIIEEEFEKRWYLDCDKGKHEHALRVLDEMYRPLVYPPTLAYSDFIIPAPGEKRGYDVGHLTRFLYQQPYEQSGETYMTTFYKNVIEKARQRIYWESISVRPAPVQKKALLDAAARGVDVRLLTNSKHSMQKIPIGGTFIYLLTRKDYRELLKGGIRIFEYTGDVPMHAKGFLVDDAVAVIGSYNATFTAEKFYTESGMAVYDTAAIRDVEKMFDDDFAQCKEVTLPDLERKAPRKNAGISEIP